MSFFAKACQEWTQRLADGELTPENQGRLKQDEEREQSRLDPWKVKHFEPVYGKRRIKHEVPKADMPSPTSEPHPITVNRLKDNHDSPGGLLLKVVHKEHKSESHAVKRPVSLFSIKQEDDIASVSPIKKAKTPPPVVTQSIGTHNHPIVITEVSDTNACSDKSDKCCAFSRNKNISSKSKLRQGKVQMRNVQLSPQSDHSPIQSPPNRHIPNIMLALQPGSKTPVKSSDQEKEELTKDGINLRRSMEICKNTSELLKLFINTSASNKPISGAKDGGYVVSVTRVPSTTVAPASAVTYREPTQSSNTSWKYNSVKTKR
ncbi:ASXL [Mytilus edulis]|uniref:ASXL n=1 Tax=Mytilus edulis TaxID=6550 RepID=A0A8S3QLC3_MYTED|nr:ASXL [Mytilus edulis]